MTEERTLEQRRASHAWDAVQSAKTRADALNYRREAKRLPVRIVTAGLGNAVAFANAKGKTSEGAAKFVADDLAQWLLENLKGTTSVPNHGRGPDDGHASRRLMQHITLNDADWLRRARHEALAYLQWLSRFAEAEIAAEDTGGQSES